MMDERMRRLISTMFCFLIATFAMPVVSYAQPLPEDLPHYDYDESVVYTVPDDAPGFYFFDEDEEDEFEDVDLAEALLELGLGDPVEEAA